MEASVKFKLETDEISNAGRGFEEANKQAKEFTKTVNDLEKSIKKLNSESKKTNTGQDTQADAELSKLMRVRQAYQAGLKTRQEYEKAIYEGEKSLRKKLESMSEKDKTYDIKLNQYRAYQTEVERIERENTQFAQKQAKAQSSYLNKEINSSISEYKKLNQQIQELANTSNKTNIGNNVLNGMLTWGVVSQLSNAFREVSSAISDVNYNTVNNLRLMGDLGDQTEKTSQILTDSAVNMAKTTGIQVTDAQQIQGAWIRINDEYAKSPELLTKISQMTAEFMNVGEIENADEAVTLLNASLLQLKDSTQDTATAAQEFLDKWAYMADKTAMGTADEYGQAISKFGAQLKNVGGTMDDAIAQSSVLADTLAMNGAEIGNALKTFNTYLTRDKTVKLFNEISEATGDTSYRLSDANGQLKEYSDILNTVAKAYQMYTSQGNDLMANKVLDSIGATRRRDVATAMLNAVNNGSYQEYLNMVQGGESANYIEEQNAKLMNTLTNQWNALIASMTGAGMALANSGIIESLTNIIQFTGDAFDSFSQLPQPVLQFITTLAELKLGLEGIKKFGEITGITKELTANFKQGSQAQREMASSVSDSVQAFEGQQKAILTANSGLYSNTEAYRDAELATFNYNNGVKKLAEQYTTGKINANQFMSGVQDLTDSYRNNIKAIDDNAQAVWEKAQAEYEAADSMKERQDAEENLKAATKEANAAHEISLKTSENLAKQNDELSSKNQKLSMTTDQLSNSQMAQGTSAGKAAFDNGTLSISETIATTTTRIFTGAVNALKTAFGVLFNPVNIIITALSLLIPYFIESTNESEKFQSQLDDMNDELDKTQSRIKELNDLRSSRGLSTSEAAELQYLKQKNTELERSIKLTEQAKANSEYTTHQGGLFGIGGTNSKHEDIQQLKIEYEGLKNQVDAYKIAVNDSYYTDEQRVSLFEKLGESNEDLTKKSAELISKYYELNDAINNGEYTGDALEQAKQDLRDLEAFLPTAQLLINSVDNTGYSFKTAADEAEEYTQAIEDAATAAEQSSNKYNALADAIASYEQNGSLTNDQVTALVGKSEEFADWVEWTGDKWVLVNGYQDKANQLQQQLTQDTIDYVDQIRESNSLIEQQAENISDMSSTLSGTKDIVSDIVNVYSGDSNVKNFSDDISKIQEEFKNGIDTLDDYNAKMKELTGNTDFSLILSSQEQIGQMNEEQINQMYAQQEMWNALYADASNSLVAITDQFNNGKITEEDYAVALAGINDRFLELALKAGIIQQTSDVFVDANGNTVEWANSLYNVSQTIGTIGGLFSDNIVLINQLMNGSAQEAQNACGQLSTSFNNTMATLKISNEDAWNAIIIKIAEAYGMGNDVEKFKNTCVTASGALTSDVTTDIDLMKAGFKELGGQMSSNLEDGNKKGTDAVDKLKTSVTDKMSVASNNAKREISSIQTAINNLKGKDITIHVNYKENGKPAGVNGIGGSMFISRFFNRAGAYGNAFAGGSIGADYSGNTLVGELGNELLVRNNRWYTVGDNGAEFIPIQKGDIVFNHEQTKDLLRSGRTTRGNGRGKAYASGNALATGSKYTSSYKITDDLDVAMTKAVQKFSKEAESLIAQAVAAGENISDSLREAAQNAEKVAKDVESYTSKYISNVESLQKRAANALEDHYKQEYDDRKKLLEKEHDAKLTAIDEEIARLKGDTTEDKEKQLSDLKDQLAKWQNDNSSLGKKKQKELQAQIDDLDKEIQIDKLEKQRDAEDESYKASIDSESDTYDAVLKSLDEKMTDENLYKTVNDLIKKNDVDTLTKLLTEHDSQWDGWKTLNGQSAQQVIQGEVQSAINNYNDVVNGTINGNGGASSNNSGASVATPNPNPTPAPVKTVSVGSTINAKGATIYSNSYGGGGGRQYYGNDPIYTVVGENNGYWLVRYHKLSSGYTGWFKKSDVTAMKTGGYTGNYEGFAYLHAKERVLNAQQTAAFEKLVYNLLPSISSTLLNGNVNNATTNNNGNVFNKELVKVDVGQIVNNTPYDIKNTEDNLDRLVRASLKKSGVNFKVK